MSGLGGGGLKTGGGGGSGGGITPPAGDIGGTTTDPIVTGIQGNPVASGTPATNDVYAWNGSEWALVALANAVIGYSRTFGWAGTVSVPSGGTNYITPFFEHVPSDTTVKLVSIRAVLQTGTNCVLAVNQNGSAVSGLGTVTVTVTNTTTAATTPPSVADGDEFAIVVASISGTPANLSVSLFFEITL